MKFYRETQYMQFRDNIIDGITQTLSNKISTQLTFDIVNEFKNNTMSSIIDIIRKEMNNICKDIIAANEKVIRNNIMKMCTSKVST